jgi:hypothetical protein
MIETIIAWVLGIINLVLVLAVLAGSGYVIYKLFGVQTSMDDSKKKIEKKFKEFKKITEETRATAKDDMAKAVTDLDTTHDSTRKEFEDKIMADESERNKAIEEALAKAQQDYQSTYYKTTADLTKNVTDKTLSSSNFFKDIRAKHAENTGTLEADITKKYETLNTRLNDYKSKYTTMNGNYSTLNNNYISLAKRVKVVDETLNGSVDGLFGDHEKAIKILARFGVTIDGTLGQLQTRSKEMSKQVGIQVATLQQTDPVVTEMKAKIAAAETQRNDLIGKLQAATATFGTSVTQNNLKNQLDSIDTSIKSLQQRLDSRLSKLSSDTQSAIKMSDNQENSLNSIKDGLMELQNNMSIFTANVNDVNGTQSEKLTAAESDVTSLQNRFTLIQGGGNMTTVQFNTILDQLTQLKSTLSANQTDTSSKLSIVQQDIAGILSKVSSNETGVKDQITSLQKNIASTQTSFKDVFSQIQLINTTVGKQITDLQTQITALNNTIKTNADTLTKLKTMQTTVDSMVSSLATTNAKLAGASKCPWINNGNSTSYKGDVFIDGILQSSKIGLGGKWVLSGVGDSQGNDNWLRLLNSDGAYSGGIATGNLWVKDDAYMNIGTITGGKSEHVSSGLLTHFPWSSDNKNYIRGDTELRGNTQNVGDLNVGRNMNVQNKLFFGDSSMSTGPNENNATDSYYLEKISKDNVSHLRLTINDDPDESFQIWGDACNVGDCNGAGALRHKFQADGTGSHTKQICIGNTCIDEKMLKAFKAPPPPPPPPPSLYSFSSHTFTTCGNTGNAGPSLSQCRSAYSSTGWASSYLNMNTQGIQEWTVPESATYKITCAGASGGDHGNAGGYGAIMQLSISLSQGTIVYILVGQRGNNGINNGGVTSGGGGGGSFVVVNGVLQTAAGGGGGGTYYGAGQAGSSSTSGTTPGSGNSGTGGTNGNGGTGSSDGSGGGNNGGGYLTDGSGGGGYTGGGGGKLNGKSYKNGGLGGIASGNSTGSFGGFGGGACSYCNGTGFAAGGGGGGGYSGGGAGPYYGGPGGGGGGSYGGTYIGTNGGAGYVTITKL